LTDQQPGGRAVPTGREPYPPWLLFYLFVRRMVSASWAKLFQLQPVLVLPLVPRGRIVPILAIAALQGNDFAHTRIPNLQRWFKGRSLLIF
jgi:hypothetical protein